MQQAEVKKEIINQLKKDLLALQGIHRPGLRQVRAGLGPLEAAFPGKVFPTGAIHEFISAETESAAATNGFIAAITARLMQQGGACLWISNRRLVYPPALTQFGLSPERIIFIDLLRAKDTLWAIEEALKCESLAAVVGEIRDLSFTESRRLQLAVENSQVTGFIHRHRPRSENTVACLTRWKIKPLPGFTEEDLPGLGHPRWDIRLLKVRNGRPGQWEFAWTPEGFIHLTPSGSQTNRYTQIKTG